MKLIVGLGNPGREHENDRHNVGFRVLDVLARRWTIDLTRKRHQAVCGRGMCGDQAVLLIKPQTFMNRSGGCVAEVVAFYQVSLTDLMVIVDDMALPLGRLRIRPGGSSGGHNGLQNIMDQLGDKAFARVRVGIGAAAPGRAVEHVLGSFRPEEKPVLETALERAAQATECWLREDVASAMSRFNTATDSKTDTKE